MTDRERDSRPTGVLPSRRAAEHVATADSEAILERVADLEVRHWDSGGDGGPDTAHLAPAAEDFQAAFDLGSADHVPAGDLDGVALAALQGLAARVAAQEEQLDRQAERIEVQQETIAAQRDDLESLRATVESVVSGIVALRRSLVDDRQP